MAALGVASGDRTFTGTVHSFALTQVIMPFTRCLPGLLPDDLRVASRAESRAAVEVAYAAVFHDQFNPHDRWTLAEEKGREFDAVVLYSMNKGAIPSQRDQRLAAALGEARRQFYVGVTRPRKELAIVYQDGNHSPWVSELLSVANKVDSWSPSLRSRLLVSRKDPCDAGTDIFIVRRSAIVGTSFPHSAMMAS